MDFNTVVSKIANGTPVKRIADGYMVKCPAHADGTASLHVSRGTTQPVVLYCHAGCEPTAILEAAGLSFTDISAEEGSRPNPTDAAEYVYTDQHGTEVFRVVRKPGKRFSQGHRVNGEMLWTLKGVTRYPYKLHEVIAGVAAGQHIWIAEGEKDVEALRERGLVATCNNGGAGKWADEFSTWFVDANVTIVADNDENGAAHANHVRESLLAAGALSVGIVKAKAGKDAYDHLVVHGYRLEDFVVAVPAVPTRKVITRWSFRDYIRRDLAQQKFALPGTLAQDEAWMVIAWEGQGKSTLVKQVALQASLGIHPWGGPGFDPRKVLFIDCENSIYDNVEDFRWMDSIARHHTPATAIDDPPITVLEPGMIDITTSGWMSWLQQEVQIAQPDLIVLSPIYKMVSKELSNEDAARALMNAVTQVQNICHSAVIMEHHTPKSTDSGGNRSLNPIGSSLIMRWCNSITGLRPLKEGEPYFALEPVRGHRRRNRRWPSHLRIGERPAHEWPWMPADETEVSYLLGNKP